MRVAHALWNGLKNMAFRAKVHLNISCMWRKEAERREKKKTNKELLQTGESRGKKIEHTSDTATIQSHIPFLNKLEGPNTLTTLHRGGNSNILPLRRVVSPPSLSQQLTAETARDARVKRTTIRKRKQRQQPPRPPPVKPRVTTRSITQKWEKQQPVSLHQR